MSELSERKPIRQTFLACCAQEASGATTSSRTATRAVARGLERKYRSRPFTAFVEIRGRPSPGGYHDGSTAGS
jgi:hypothetical protein